MVFGKLIRLYRNTKMPRIDDYISAGKIAVEKLSGESLETVSKRSGFEISEDQTLLIPFLDKTFSVRFPDFEFKDMSGQNQEVPIQEQVLILHYLMSQSTSNPSGNWISYREIPGASFYFSVFVKRAVDPLKTVFGKNIQGLLKAVEHFKCRPMEPGDASFEFQIFPRISLQVILWEGDDEFPPEANILFDEIIGEILSPEDVAWLSGMVVYRLIARGR